MIPDWKARQPGAEALTSFFGFILSLLTFTSTWARVAETSPVKQAFLLLFCLLFQEHGIYKELRARFGRLVLGRHTGKADKMRRSGVFDKR